MTDWIELDAKVGGVLWGYLRQHLGRGPSPLGLWETCTTIGYALTIIGHPPSQCPVMRLQTTWDVGPDNMRVNEQTRYWIATGPGGEE